MQKVKKLKQYLIRCCYWYYVKSDPLISDRAFDGLFNELKRREQEQGDFGMLGPDKDSPTQMIYGDREAQYTEDWMKTKDDMGVPDAERA